jgi:hypothetical protein
MASDHLRGGSRYPWRRLVLVGVLAAAFAPTGMILGGRATATEVWLVGTDPVSGEDLRFSIGMESAREFLYVPDRWTRLFGDEECACWRSGSPWVSHVGATLGALFGWLLAAGLGWAAGRWRRRRAARG